MFIRTAKPNRYTSRKPKGGLSWCGVCDAEVVGDGEKCKNCDVKSPVKRYKKSYWVE